MDLAAMMARKDKVVRELTAGIAYLLKKNKIEAITGTRSRQSASVELRTCLPSNGRVILEAESQDGKLEIPGDKILVCGGRKAYTRGLGLEAIGIQPDARTGHFGSKLELNTQLLKGLVQVSTEKGLMVPVLRDADKLAFAQIEKGIAELAVRARDGKISVADLWRVKDRG